MQFSGMFWAAVSGKRMIFASQLNTEWLYQKPSGCYCWSSDIDVDKNANPVSYEKGSVYECSFSLFGALGILTVDTIPIANLDIIRGKTNLYFSIS